MSLSNSNSGPQSLEDTENKHRQHQQTSAKKNSQSERDPEPACWRRRVDDWSWHVTEFNAAFSGMYGPCPDCFADGSPDVNEIERVVRSCSYPTTYHRIGDPARADSEEETGTATVATQFVTDADAGESIESVTELEEGDGVLWDGLSTPAVVIEATTEPKGMGRLRGLGGGEYTVEGRPSQTRPIAIYPAIGLVADVCRVRLPDDYPRPEPETV